MLMWAGCAPCSCADIHHWRHCFLRLDFSQGCIEPIPSPNSKYWVHSAWLDYFLSAGMFTRQNSSTCRDNNVNLFVPVLHTEQQGWKHGLVPRNTMNLNTMQAGPHNYFCISRASPIRAGPPVTPRPPHPVWYWKQQPWKHYTFQLNANGVGTEQLQLQRVGFHRPRGRTQKLELQGTHPAHPISGSDCSFVSPRCSSCGIMINWNCVQTGHVRSFAVVVREPSLTCGVDYKEWNPPFYQRKESDSRILWQIQDLEGNFVGNALLTGFQHCKALQLQITKLWWHAAQNQERREQR